MEKKPLIEEKYFKKEGDYIIFGYFEDFSSGESDCLCGKFKENHFYEEIDKLIKYGKANLLGRFCTLDLSKKDGKLIKMVFTNSTKNFDIEIPINQILLTA